MIFVSKDMVSKDCPGIIQYSVRNCELFSPKNKTVENKCNSITGQYKI